MHPHCPRRTELALRLLEQDGAFLEAPEWAGHVAACSECRAALSELQSAERYAKDPRVSALLQSVLAQAAQPSQPVVVASGAKSAWLAAAAVLLVAVGGLVMWRPWDSSSGPRVRAEAVTAPTKDRFLFLRAEGLDGDAPQAVLHEMRDFKIVKRSAGEVVCDATIHAVRADGLTLSVNGSSKDVTAQQLQREFSEAAREEVAQYASAFRANALSTADLDRLAQLARLEQGDAVALLESIVAKEGSADLAKHASTFLGDQSKVAYLKGYIGRLRAPEQKRKLEMLDTLSQETGPIARGALRDFALDDAQPESARVHAVERLAAYNDAYAAHALGEIHAGATGAVSQRAGELGEGLLRSLQAE